MTIEKLKEIREPLLYTKEYGVTVLTQNVDYFVEQIQLETAKQARLEVIEEMINKVNNYIYPYSKDEYEREINSHYRNIIKELNELKKDLL